MYLWIVLATFLAALAGYILPLRNDMVGVVDTPVAQAMMMQMVVKHKAGVEFMKHNGWPFKCPAGTQASGECENHSLVDYNDLTDVETGSADFITFGFVNNTSYVNEIKCVCDNGSNGNPNYVSATNCNTSCTSNPKLAPLRGLLTTGPIPQRWLMFVGDEIKPSGDLTTAMRKHFSHSQMAGYMVTRDNHYYIRNFEGIDYLIPDMFNNKNCLDNNDACFAYLSWE